MKHLVTMLATMAVGMAATSAHAEWFKGNTHCHSEVSSDSNTPQEELFGWYKTHGYHFVVMTDHNRYTPQSELDTRRYQGEDLVDDGFILIAGEELTVSAHHINGIDIPFRLDPASTISGSFERIWEAGGLPQLNHPEYNYLEAREIAEEFAELDGPMFLEVYNSHPVVVRRSGPSSEDIWDGVLGTGRKVFGVAVDDAHTLPGGETPPGGGYIWVDAEELSIEGIVSAMQAGRFYASSGAVIDDFSVGSTLYEVDAPGAAEIVFLGEHGRVLERISGDYASYTIQGDEVYVRARVESPDGVAWTQPAYISELPDNEPPTARIDATPQSGHAPLFVTLDGRGSSDIDGEVITWRWDFGDGTEGRGEVIAHEYLEPGSYTVELTVFDDASSLDRTSLAIDVSEPNGDAQGDAGQDDTGSPSADVGVEDATQSDSPDADDDPGRVLPPSSRTTASDEGCSVNWRWTSPRSWRPLLRR